MGRIGIGVGGWTFAPWRNGVFYPKGLAQAKELGYAASQLTAIEVNATYRSSMKPDTFAKWADQVPDDFVFALKGPMFATNRRDLAEAAPSIERFVNSGVDQLGSKLGPINWQFKDTKKFDAENFETFLKLLPPDAKGVPLRHAVEVRNETFVCPEFVNMARKYGVAIVIAAHETYPQIADLTAPFIYARWQIANESGPLGYPEEELARLSDITKSWAKGAAPEDGLRYAGDPDASVAADRDVFLFMISGHKERNPAAAMNLIERVGRGG
ncbi:MAG: DUF72 domain-containing protein [Hyphomicrobiaceae bacterium]|nr:DUF72 domain-containing protein [Hyphomicrobiaceae bacterium]MCC0024183.1 DUF72 domain-containing protein [Hyphomicrobiaceae bacterium]